MGMEPMNTLMNSTQLDGDNNLLTKWKFDDSPKNVRHSNSKIPGVQLNKDLPNNSRKLLEPERFPRNLLKVGQSQESYKSNAVVNEIGK